MEERSLPDGWASFLESGLDSSSLATVVIRLGDSLGIDPFESGSTIEFPVTFGDFVRVYARRWQCPDQGTRFTIEGVWCSRGNLLPAVTGAALIGRGRSRGGGHSTLSSPNVAIFITGAACSLNAPATERGSASRATGESVLGNAF